RPPPDPAASGARGMRFPAGASKDERGQGLRADGRDQRAGMLTGMSLVPGQGIDFKALGAVLLGVLVLYACAALAGWLQAYILAGVVQRTMYRLREDVETKLGRLPLRYFDRSARGDVLSRVTNDIDNISQTMTQTMSQLVTAVLTVLGVLVMMFVVSPLLALIALVT